MALMPIPKLNRYGFLPEGIHTCTLADVRKRFGSFATSDHRIRLCDSLFELIVDIASTRLVKEIIIDGSFVTDKIKPSHIDLILVLKKDMQINWDELPFKDYNALSKKRLARKYKFDVFFVTEGTETYTRRIDFFRVYAIRR
jgi:hypothetical protein